MGLIDRIDDSFTKAVEIIYKCKGRVVVTGMGKSGWIGNKIAATLASTGTPAFFLHPAEGMHGDIGMITKEDVVLALSNSGETKELNEIIPVIKRLGIDLISLTGNENSALAKASTVVINTGVKREACPLGLAPTASTTAALAMGDAIAIALLEKRGFKKEDFAMLHPGGSLGKKLILRVKDLMHQGSEIPLVEEETLMRDALVEMTSKKLGFIVIENSNKELTGIITDGDLRRIIEKYGNFLDKRTCELMTKNPKTITEDALVVEALHLMEKHSITSLIVSPDKKRIDGVIHLHDILKSGIV
ncbi:MAG: KpsF/GutQ family sugar-phosphate isomerase [Candidatus Schekmanbacteria bacterium]|nr:MAG: KpsF/GutQ family sugar-phosphate isomerase [Candidatus Schekmanbacteria bacterium]